MKKWELPKTSHEIKRLIKQITESEKLKVWIGVTYKNRIYTLWAMNKETREIKCLNCGSKLESINYLRGMQHAIIFMK